MNKGQAGPAFAFLLSIIFLILIVSVSGCLLTHFTEVSSQGKESFGKISSEIVRLNNELEIGSVEAVNYNLDPKQIIIGVNSGGTLWTDYSDDDRSPIEIMQPSKCDPKFSCICNCAIADTKEWVVNDKFVCNQLECASLGDIKFGDSLVYSNQDKGEKHEMRNGFSLERLCSAITQQYRFSLCGERQKTLYVQKIAQNELVVCEYLIPGIGCQDGKQ